MLNLTPSTLAQLGLERRDLLPLAVKNIHLRYPNAEVIRSEGFGMVVKAGDLESSWMLDFDFWKEESKRFEGALVASVPSREVMVWADSTNAQLVATLRAKGAEVVEREQASNRALSALLYVWREDHWDVYT